MVQFFLRLIQVLFFLSSLVPLQVLAGEQVGSLGKGLAEAISRLPEGPSKQGLIRYLSIVSPGSYKNDGMVGTGNKGIQDYFENKFENDDHFAEMAFRFYGAIKKMDSTSERPSLKDVSGEGQFQKKKKGWLWELALTNIWMTTSFARCARLIFICRKVLVKVLIFLRS